MAPIRKPPSLTERVEQFVAHIRSHLTEVESLKCKHEKLYRGLVYVALLDSLGRAVMPHRSSQHERFVAFVQRFCRWGDGDRVSVPHLLQLLRRNPDPAFESLRTWTSTKFKGMKLLSGQITPISDDPTFDDVKRVWPISKEHRTPIEGVSLESLQHYELLYAYRNSLVHELRELGYGMDFIGDDDTTPYYHSMHTDEGGALVETAELVYPAGFLRNLCVTGIDELRDYFLRNELDPYASFAFGSYWLRQLNK
jgi:hypothetical protein